MVVEPWLARRIVRVFAVCAVMTGLVVAVFELHRGTPAGQALLFGLSGALAGLFVPVLIGGALLLIVLWVELAVGLVFLVAMILLAAIHRPSALKVIALSEAMERLVLVMIRMPLYWLLRPPAGTKDSISDEH